MFALSKIGFACLAALRAAQCFSPPFFHLEDVGMEPENFKSGRSQYKWATNRLVPAEGPTYLGF